MKKGDIVILLNSPIKKYIGKEGIIVKTRNAFIEGPDGLESERLYRVCVNGINLPRYVGEEDLLPSPLKDNILKEILIISGPTACGKTTLLNHLLYRTALDNANIRCYPKFYSTHKLKGFIKKEFTDILIFDGISFSIEEFQYTLALAKGVCQFTNLILVTNDKIKDIARLSEKFGLKVNLIEMNNPEDRNNYSEVTKYQTPLIEYCNQRLSGKKLTL